VYSKKRQRNGVAAFFGEFLKPVEDLIQPVYPKETTLRRNRIALIYNK
jgi:hypothetical protein